MYVLPYLSIHHRPQLLQHTRQIFTGAIQVASLDQEHACLKGKLYGLGVLESLEDLYCLAVIIGNEEVGLGQFELVELVEVAYVAAAAVRLHGQVVVLVVEELA